MPRFITSFALVAFSLAVAAGDDGRPGTAAADDFYDKGTAAYLKTDWPAAEPHFRQALELYRKSDPDGRTCADAFNALGAVQVMRYRNRDARPNLEAAFALRKRLDGEGHPDTLTAAVNLAQVYRDLGRYREAEALFAAAWIHRKSGHPSDQGRFLGATAHLYEAAGRPDDAIRCLRKAIALHERAGGPVWHRSSTWHTLGKFLVRAGRLDEAKAALDKAVEVDPDRKKYMTGECGRYHLAAGDAAKGRKLLTDAIEEAGREPHPDPERLAELTFSLGEACVQCGDRAAGRKLLDDAVAKYEALYGPDHPRVAAFLQTHSRLFPADAKASLTRAARIREANKGNEPRGLEAAFGDLP